MASDNEQDTRSTPADAPASLVGDSRAREHPATQNRRAANPAHKRPAARPKALVETSGPDPGSPIKDVKLAVGVIGGTHGVHGELKLKLLTDHPENLSTLDQVFLGESEVPTRLLGVRFHGDQALILLDGVSSPEEGKRLGGLKVRIAGSDARALEEGEYFLFQLIGLEAVTGNGERVGTVTDLIETGAHDVLVILPDSGAAILVPNHPRFVLEISPEHNRIVIEPPAYES